MNTAWSRTLVNNIKKNRCKEFLWFNFCKKVLFSRVPYGLGPVSEAEAAVAAAAVGEVRQAAAVAVAAAVYRKT